MDKEKQICFRDETGYFLEVRVPGIEQFIELIRREFPLLSDEAICRILGLVPKGSHPIEQESGNPETSIATQMREVKE